MKDRFSDAKTIITCWLIAVIVIGALLSIGILTAYIMAGR